jgi:hypothetical protein
LAEIAVKAMDRCVFIGTEYKGSDVGSQFKQGAGIKFDKQQLLTGNDP